MKRVSLMAAMLVYVGLSACSHSQIFPQEVMEGVDPNFDFSRWRMLPNQAAGKTIQLGGRIIQSESREGSTTIAVAQLPIVEHPAYGPKDTGKRSDEFAVSYQGKIDSAFLQRGNRIIVVGTTRPAMLVSIDDVPHSLPTVSAKCVHIWMTGGRDIADFPSFGAGYETLEEQTLCASPQ